MRLIKSCFFNSDLNRVAGVLVEDDALELRGVRVVLARVLALAHLVFIFVYGKGKGNG